MLASPMPSPGQMKDTGWRMTTGSLGTTRHSLRIRSVVINASLRVIRLPPQHGWRLFASRRVPIGSTITSVQRRPTIDLHCFHNIDLASHTWKLLTISYRRRRNPHVMQCHP